MTEPVRAAVLVPICRGPEGPEVILTLRSEGLSHHRGQVSFPGGRFDPSCDQSILATALREAEEEIGMRPADVEVLGALPELHTMSSSFLISPFVGRVPRNYEYTPHDREVAAIFSMPLRAHGDPAFRVKHSWTYDGRTGEVPAIRYDTYLVWGATLRILDTLIESPLMAQLE